MNENKMTKQLEELLEKIYWIKEEIFMHNEKKFAEVEKLIRGFKYQIDDEVADMMQEMEADAIRRNLMTVEDAYASQEADARGIDK